MVPGRFLTETALFSRMTLVISKGLPLISFFAFKLWVMGFGLSWIKRHRTLNDTTCPRNTHLWQERESESQTRWKASVSVIKEGAQTLNISTLFYLQALALFCDMKLLLGVSEQCLHAAQVYQQTSHSNQCNWHLIWVCHAVSVWGCSVALVPLEAAWEAGGGQGSMKEEDEGWRAGEKCFTSALFTASLDAVLTRY